MRVASDPRPRPCQRLGHQPAPGSKRERDLIAAQHPEFLAEYTAGVQQARDASHGDGQGGGTHSAVKAWRDLLSILRIDSLRPIAPGSPLDTVLGELDVCECYCWWLVTQRGVNHETARGYLSTVNAWHERQTGVKLVGGYKLTRVWGMLDGLARLRGVPPPRIKRVGVRPRCLQAGQDAIYSPTSPDDYNLATAQQTALVGLARVGEISVGGKWQFDTRRHPTRADVSFVYGKYATVKWVNSKAKGVEAFRKLPHRLPWTGTYLSPGAMLYHLTEILDPVPAERRADTPLFRRATTGKAITLVQVRSDLKRAMEAVGLDGSWYGAHSLRIGGGTAMYHEKAPPDVIKAAGVWSSDAYLRYLRECEDSTLDYGLKVCNADVDDLATTDFLDIDATTPLDDDDYE